MNKWKPTQAECDLIRAAAKREAGRGGVALEVGRRFNLERALEREGADSNINIALVTSQPDWDDTDLDECLPWKVFRKGVDLTSDGRAVVDFYISGRTVYGNELLGNVVAHYAGGRIVKLEGFGSVKDWLPYLD